MLLATALLVAGVLAADNANANALEAAAGGIPLRLSARRPPHRASLERRAGNVSGAIESLSIHAYSTYLASIEVGTPPQSILVQFSPSKTSFIQLYEGGNDGDAHTDITGRSFSPGHSSTFKTTNKLGAPTTEYNKTGRADSDLVSIGGYRFNDLPFYGLNNTNNAILLSRTGAAGVVTLGFNADSNTEFGDPLWKRIVEAGGAAEAGLCLERIITVDDIGPLTGNESHQDNAGELMLGAINPKYYKGEINYMNITTDESGAAYVPFDGFKVNGEPLASVNQTVDSGIKRISGGGNITFDVSVPGNVTLNMGRAWSNLGNAAFDALRAKIPGSKPVNVTPSSTSRLLRVPCDTDVEISLTFNGQDYPLRPEDWITHGTASPIPNCVCLFLNVPLFANSISDAFLQTVYTAFKFDTRQIGFGRVVDGLPTRNTTVNGSVTVDVPTPTRSYVNVDNTGSANTAGSNTTSNGASPTPSSPALALQPRFVTALLSALSVTAASLFVEAVAKI